MREERETNLCHGLSQNSYLLLRFEMRTEQICAKFNVENRNDTTESVDGGFGQGRVASPPPFFVGWPVRVDTAGRSRYR